MPELVSPERWARIKDAFERTLELSATERTAVLSGEDAAVRREVEALLAAHDGADGFLEVAAPAPIEPGLRFGPYEIVGQVGGGGMGEVYRARDTRLDREVALKVVKAATDPEMQARFQREARAIAALSHPGVLAVFDVGHAHGRQYLVTELLAGETLRARLGRERPTVTQAVAWASQLARGLAAAHAAGLVHRDLKPENVFVVAGDEVKILDFGLARPLAVDDRASGARPPPVDDGLSATGAVLGTAGYLAPEQARGELATPAVDLFALGAILYELVTGARAFPGDDARARIRAVLEREPPPPSSVRPGLPRWLDLVIARCLAKEPHQRFGSAADLAFVLEHPPAVASASPTAPRATAPQPTVAPPRRWWPLAAALALLALGLGGGALVAATGRATSASRPPPRTYALTYGGLDREPAVAPRGDFLAFTSERDGQARIWLKQLDTGSETALTAGPDSGPRFSPAGDKVLFTRRNGAAVSLHQIDVLGVSSSLVVADAESGDWSPDGERVAFVRRKLDGDRPRFVLGIARLDGGEVRELPVLEDRPHRGRSVGHYVRWSPDGRWIAVSGLVTQPGAPQYILLVPTAGGPPRRLVPYSKVGLISAVVWDGGGALIYSQASSAAGNASAGSAACIVRQPIDGGRPQVLAWTIESSLVLDRWHGHGLVYDVRAGRQNLRELPRGGGRERALSAGTASDRQPTLSAAGRDVVFSSNRNGQSLDLWAIERATGAARRLTDHPADDWDPALSPDGTTLLWSSNRTGSFEIWTARADGTNPRRITDDGDAENPSIGADGTWIVYASGLPGRAGVWRARPDGSEARQLVPDGVLPEISPDGRYVLFLSNRAPGHATIGVAEVATGRRLPFTIEVEQVRPSTVLVGRARWAPDGRGIAFVGQDERGATGVYLQAFQPAAVDTSATRIALVGFDPARPIESFDLDDDTVVVAEPDPRSDVMVAAGLAP